MGVRAIFSGIEPHCTGHEKREPPLPRGTCSWEFYSNGSASLTFVCPCGCGEVDFINVTLPPKQKYFWEWDGNRESPTIKPSIFRTGAACKWHGWLTKGEFIKV